MKRLLLTVAAGAVWAGAALANPTCVIIVPTDQTAGHAKPWLAELHEMTHCKGWEDDGSIMPPLKWTRAPWPAGLGLKVFRLPTTLSTAACNAAGGNSYACQWIASDADDLADSIAIVKNATH
jgi:hypothetical protein